jgi:hypothetical protein
MNCTGTDFGRISGREIVARKTTLPSSATYLIIAIAGPLGSRMVPIAREPSSFFTFVVTRTYSSPALTNRVAVSDGRFGTSRLEQN